MADQADNEAASSKSIAQGVVEELLGDTRFQLMMKGILSDVMDEKLVLVKEKLSKLEKKCEALEEQLDRKDGDIFELNEKLDEQTSKFQNLEKQFGEVANRVYFAEKSVQETQQYTRRNCLLITGIPESTEKDDNGKPKPENTDKIVIDLAKNELNIDITEDQIDRTHRTAKPKKETNKPRPIIAKFVSHNTRDRIIKARRKMKGKGVGIHDLLTKDRQNLLKYAKQVVERTPRFRSAWTWEGDIHILLDYNAKGEMRKFKANSQYDIDNLAQMYGKYQVGGFVN